MIETLNCLKVIQEVEDDKCCVCNKKVKIQDEWFCEICGNIHHPNCSGEEGGDYGEYPDETAYSICQKCVDKQECQGCPNEHIVPYEDAVSVRGEKNE